eukprot:COSAG02_NODE_19261_length_891_cov_5.000000_1_plen_43_part_10
MRGGATPCVVGGGNVQGTICSPKTIEGSDNRVGQAFWLGQEIF